jgi:urease subunit gamma/beta
MRPGEILPDEAPVPAAPVRRRARLTVRNTGRFPAYLSSHFPLQWASAALEFPREGLEGARLDLPAGASVRIPPGEAVDVEVVWT